MKDFFNHNKSLTIATLIAVSFFLFSKSFVAIGELNLKERTANPVSTITVRKSAEVKAKPDMAIVRITIRESEKETTSAQQQASEKNNKLLAFLQKKNIEANDIKTENYSTYPQYSYEQQTCKKKICPPAKRVISGYETTMTISVKIKDLNALGEILNEVSKLGINEVSAPNFIIENNEKFRLEAQELAIKKAKEEAEITAKNLNVKLGKIIKFHQEPEYRNDYRSFGVMAMKASSEIVPQFKTGQEITSATVVITYEILQ